ncbi:MAG: 4Fe-4S dicluster domain-containing protein [Bacteroidales bacterium]|nr:4Fe-4S dicluster domain-containing protein [Bacteroidales bacterium]
MIDFGYGLTPSSTLKIENVKNPLFGELVRLEPDVVKCIACGSCTASCSAGAFTEMSLRRVILSLQRGREKETLPMLRHCMLCGKCLLVCPRGINTRHLILSIGKVYKLEEKA